MTTAATRDARGPLIDRAQGAPGMRRLLLLGAALLILAGLLVLFGHAFGRPALLAIFGLLAMVGIAGLFALALGLVTFAGRARDGSIAAGFLDSTAEGVVIAAPSGRVVYANRAYGALTGAGGAESVRTPEQLLARESEASEAVYHLSNLVREERSGEREFRLSHGLEGAPANLAGPGGEPRWYRLSVRPLAARAGTMQAWRMVDVTGERQREERSFQDLKDAIDYLDRAPAGFVATDEAGRVAYINATLAAWLGVDLADFRPFERKFEEFVPEAARPLLEDDEPQSEAAPREAARVVDLDLRSVSGASVPVRLFRRTESRVSGGRAQTRMLVVDRRVEVRSADPAEVVEARFTRFFNASPIAIASLDRGGLAVRSNAVFRHLFGAAAANGEAAAGAGLSKASADSYASAFAAAVEGQAGLAPLDVEVAGEPTRVVRVYMSAMPATDASGEEAALLYGVDITEQRSLEEQFAKSQKMQAIGNLAGGIAHDFNNVLTIITNSVDFLLLNHKTGDPSFQDLILIKQNTNRAASLVRQLLAYSRRQTMRPKMLNLTDVIADMHLLLKRVSGDLVGLQRSHGRDLWPVMADIGQLEQVVTNLVQNARDAMPEGGTITISTRNVPAAETRAYGHPTLPLADQVLIEVADTGTGMPPEVAERIFEPFYTTKDVGKGTGLGLSMAYGIIEQSGGHIFVDSTPGQGTTFRIFLPRHIPEIALETDAPGDKREADKGPTDLSGTASILLVEDEDHVRAGNVRALKMRGYEVFEAASGIEALEVLEEEGDAIQLVVSDVVMPEMDGPTLLKEMRAKHPDLKFIFVSGYAEEAFSKNLPENEQFDFLAKPFSLRELAVAVKKTLDQ